MAAAKKRKHSYEESYYPVIEPREVVYISE